MSNKKELLKFIESYIDEDNENEVNIYSYKNVTIYENLFCENEFSVDGDWFNTIEDAMNSIDKDEVYKNLSLDDKNFIDNYNKRKFCSMLENLCPFDDKEKCNGCVLYDSYLLIKQKSINDKILYDKIMKNN